MSRWTAQKVRALAPDAPTARKANNLASVRFWKELEGNETAIWGACKTESGGTTQTSIQLQGPVFHCNCSLPKYPCQHTLALLLIYVQQSDAFRITSEKPDWMEAEKPVQKFEEVESKVHPPLRFPSRLPDIEKRLTLMQSGLKELEIWLADIFRQGIASLETQPPSFWKEASARLVDAKLGGLARRLRSIPPMLRKKNWHEQVLILLSELFLVASAYKKIEKLPVELQEDLLTLVGVNYKKENLFKHKGLFDTWLVLGSVKGLLDESLYFRRTWFCGHRFGETGFFLEFNYGSPQFNPLLKIGSAFHAEAIYYPSAFPSRLILKQPERAKTPPDLDLPGYETLSAMTQAFAKAINAFPWLSVFPCLLKGVVPVKSKKSLTLVDREGKKLPFESQEGRPWHLLAFSAGHPIDLFAEWNGEVIRPISVVNGAKIQEI